MRLGGCIYKDSNVLFKMCVLIISVQLIKIKYFIKKKLKLDEKNSEVSYFDWHLLRHQFLDSIFHP